MRRVVRAGLLIGVGKVGRPRPRCVGKGGDGLGTVGEALDAPVELLQHPRRAVAAAHILHVEHPRVHKRVVRLSDDLPVGVNAFEERIWVGEPYGVAIEVEDVETMVEDEALEQSLARLEEYERRPAEPLVVQRWRPLTCPLRGPPYAGDGRHDLPERLTRADLVREDEHVPQSHRREREDQVDAHPDRAIVSHAQQHHLAVGSRRGQHAAQRRRVIEITAGPQYVSLWRHVLVACVAHELSASASEVRQGVHVATGTVQVAAV